MRGPGAIGPDQVNSVVQDHVQVRHGNQEECRIFSIGSGIDFIAANYLVRSKSGTFWLAN